MVRCNVSAADQNRLCFLNIVVRVRGGACAQHQLHRRGCGRVADAGTTVDVVRTDYDAREFLRKVVLLVRCAGGAKHPNSIWTMFFRDLLQARGCKRDRLVPRKWPPSVVSSKHRNGNPVGSMHKIKGETSFDA